MDAGSDSHYGVASLWSRPALVGAADAFTEVVYALRTLPTGLAYSVSSLARFAHATSLLCHYDAHLYVNAHSHSRVHSYAHTHAHPGAGCGPGVS
jgi:hypothetical protein